MDELRSQLEVAFDEVAERLDRLEGRLVTRLAEGQADLPVEHRLIDVAPLAEHITRLTDATLDGLDELRKAVRTALAVPHAAAISSPEIETTLALLAESIQDLRHQPAGIAGDVPDVSAIEERIDTLAKLVEDRLPVPHPSAISPSEIETTLALLAESIQDLRHQPGGIAGDVPDVSAIEERIDTLAKVVEDRLAEGSSQIGQGLAGVRRVLRAMQERPAVVDMRAVEDAASRASLSNAADLANLRYEVTSLTDAVRMQEKGIGELRAAMDWIKDRMFPH